MEEVLKEELEKIYNFPVDVEFVDFRIYKILFKIEEKEKSVIHKYDMTSTIDNEVMDMTYKIDKAITDHYKIEK